MAEGSAGIVRIAHSAVFLPEGSALKRAPRAPRRRRPASFWARFEDRALFYDCFWDRAGAAIVLVAPAPQNLLPHYREAAVRAMPSGTPVAMRLHPSRSTLVCRVADAPAGTTALEIALGGHAFTVPVQASAAEGFAGAKIMATMNKDNPLDWVAAWADWHARLHGVEALIVFDNGSTRYDLGALEETLAAVKGISRVLVVDWPYRYGDRDPGVLMHPYWSNFLQVASFQVIVRRLAPEAAGILNCDIDELVGTGRDGETAFEALEASPDGFVRLKGVWVEAARADSEAGQSHHLAYRYRHANPLKAVCADKWALDPRGGWAQGFDHVPMMHRVYGMERAWVERAPVLPFWHFKAINTDWKQERSAARPVDAARHRRLVALDTLAARYQGLAISR